MPLCHREKMAERLDSDEEETIAQDVVVTKYKMAGDIANREWPYCKTLRSQR